MSGAWECVWAGMLWCGVNRRLRRRERTTATAPRRSTAFRAQDRHEKTKQAMQPAQRGTTAPVKTGTMAPVETRSEAGCLDCVQPQPTHRCMNRRLRRRERTTTTAPRRSTAFRAQDRHEKTKQAMQPAQRGTTAPVKTGTMAPVETRSEAGCLDCVQPQPTHRCMNRRPRRSERTTTTAPRRSTAFRAQDG